MMPNTDDEEQNTELADKHDGAEVSREQISGTFEYTVVLDDETLDKLPERTRPEDFAESIAASRFNKEIDPTFTVSAGDAMAKEETEYYMVEGGKRFTVWVRFDKNE